MTGLGLDGQVGSPERGSSGRASANKSGRTSRSKSPHKGASIIMSPDGSRMIYHTPGGESPKIPKDLLDPSHQKVTRIV